MTVGSSLAQNEKAITPDMLKQMGNSFKEAGAEKAIYNALTNNDLRQLVVNRDLKGRIDHHYAVKLDIKGITDQHSTGRCWLFTGLNVLRYKVISKLNLKKFEFSENYSFFWDQLEKANLFLEGILETRKRPMDDRKVEWLFKHPIGDGGVWNMMVAVVEKYGLVPVEAMPETHHSKNTGMMSRMVRRRLREAGLKLRRMHQDGQSLARLREEKSRVLSDVYRMLALHLGQPPESFVWRYEDKEGKLSEAKTFTPLEFYRHTVDVDLHDYVMLMDDPTREYYKLYEIEYDRNRVDAENWKYVNVPCDVIKQFAKRSLIAGEAMYFSCDVGKQLDRGDGVLSLENYDYASLYGFPFGMNKADRIRTFESGSTHGMALVGVDTSASGETTKWLLENSWGSKAGHNGFLTMTDAWFDEYMFRLVVPKKFVTPDVLAVLKQKPIPLKPWDPMFLPFDDK
jgi:bleomycin hydrolase